MYVRVVFLSSVHEQSEFHTGVLLGKGIIVHVKHILLGGCGGMFPQEFFNLGP